MIAMAGRAPTTIDVDHVDDGQERLKSSTQLTWRLARAVLCRPVANR
jgi:hypothetical protein